MYSEIGKAKDSLQYLINCGAYGGPGLQLGEYRTGEWLSTIKHLATRVLDVATVATFKDGYPPPLSPSEVIQLESVNLRISRSGEDIAGAATLNTISTNSLALEGEEDV